MTRFEQLYGIPLAKRRRMEILIALMALEIIFAFSYLGFIIIPPISITTMHLLVMIAAMILGTRESVAVSLVFAEWASLGKGKFKRRDFRLDILTGMSAHLDQGTLFARHEIFTSIRDYPPATVAELATLAGD